MPLRSDWQALYTLIQGFLSAGRFYVETLGPNREDAYSVADKQLLPQARTLFAQLGTFRDSYSQQLPEAAVKCLNRFLDGNKDFFIPDAVKGLHGVRTCLVPLAAFSSEFAYYLADFAAQVRRVSARAFSHLQRSIVADRECAQRWREAFDKGEPACEKLGAAHLLLHGIWAFKVNAEGERTDLVLGEPLHDLSEAQAVADALVLTEWKVVRRTSELQEKLQEAKGQAARYGAGVLAGFELADYRYLVMVSADSLQMPPDVIEGEIRYRHVNIAVAPQTPSRAPANVTVSMS